MEKPSSISMLYSLVFLEPVGLFFLVNLLMVSLSKLFAKSFVSFYARLFATLPHHNHNHQKIAPKCHDRDVMLTREEINSIITKIGIASHTDDKELKEITGLNEICGLFEEVEPSLEEAKQAFYVFDQNKDGFIDAEELQKALLKIGFREKGLEITECMEMIAAYDLNNDDRIDFMEFVKFLEASFC
ncbi:Calcium-binding EF hand family protein [Rhynchospora pubera]|uniref:Calcium-binding EF hand family protein n=1 Tax=Rhynchospora pubera TaxID=906938 RepID=A0AAV8D1X6_9POAL|nr:Calcium-binding EF hand family protein [Rhynchospora pubera]